MRPEGSPIDFLGNYRCGRARTCSRLRVTSGASRGERLNLGSEHQIRRALRTGQVYLSALAAPRFWIQENARRAFRVPAEKAYKAFRLLPLIDGAQFLDVGANRGQTIASFRLYDQHSEILAFEPNPTHCSLLSRRESRDSSLAVFPFGLGNEAGEFDLWVPRYRGFVFDGLASFDRESAEGWLNSSRLLGFDKKHLHLEKMRCEVRRWDDVDTRPGLVKLDVQGFEFDVLRGGLSTIRNFRPVILAENPTTNYETLLLSEGYRIACFRDDRFYLDTPGIHSTFFLPEERATDAL